MGRIGLEVGLWVSVSFKKSLPESLLRHQKGGDDLGGVSRGRLDLLPRHAITTVVTHSQ